MGYKGKRDMGRKMGCGGCFLPIGKGNSASLRSPEFFSPNRSIPIITIQHRTPEELIQGKLADDGWKMGGKWMEFWRNFDR